MFLESLLVLILEIYKRIVRLKIIRTKKIKKNSLKSKPSVRPRRQQKARQRRKHNSHLKKNKGSSGPRRLRQRS
jgi:hypothetical protein